MKIRKAASTDIEKQLEVFDFARSIMRNTGNMNQWTDGYPSREVVENDIAAGNSYVCIDDSGEIVATFCFGKEMILLTLILKTVNGLMTSLTE